MKTKIALILVGVVFGLPFLLGGLFLGAWPMIDTLINWKQAQSWQQAPAIVLEAELDTHHGKKSTTYQVSTRYRYTFAGKAYESERIGLDDGIADNIGSWHQDWHRELERKKQSKEAIPVWVNPENPSEAVIDRNVRWGKLIFMIPFALLFPAVGMAAMWVMWKAIRTPASEMESKVVKPNPPVMVSDGWSTARGMWIMVCFWGLITLPIAMLVLQDPEIPLIARGFILIFPAINVFFIRSAILRTLSWRRYGLLRLTLSPEQPRLGEALSGTIRFDKCEGVSGEYTLLLACDLVNARRRGPSFQPIWRQDQQLQRMGDTLRFRFDLPATAPASQPYGSPYHRWQLRIKSGDLPEQLFDLNVFPAQQL